MVVYIVIGKMNRIKEKTLIERKETLKKEREEYNKRYFEKKASKNKTTDVLISKLQDRLVQCCIDFINENNLGDLERVDFNVDGLQISSEFGIPSLRSRMRSWSLNEYQLMYFNGFLENPKVHDRLLYFVCILGFLYIKSYFRTKHTNDTMVSSAVPLKSLSYTSQNSSSLLKASNSGS